ncbi:hypothetical protein D1BOALGB6SA_76 [Olavius sp. associated proteobacterium Delta 1]|nr:hypothetical protein D1BOALGB6SA_76 [Olavius sp. associated proteobacterium Delta 1]
MNEQLQAYAEETVPPPQPAAVTADGEEGIAAVALSEGIALGPIFHYRASAPDVPRQRAENPDREWEDLLHAKDKTCEAILQRRRAMAPGLGKTRAAIFDAHLLIVQDPTLLDQTRRRIFKNGENAAWAWQQSVLEIADTYRELSDDYLRQRADDVVDVGRQVLLDLLGQSVATAMELPHPAILVAGELSPTDTVMLDTAQVLGIVTVAGGPASGDPRCGPSGVGRWSMKPTATESP